MIQKNKKGFSLIELMIVIAIMAIMAAIMLSMNSKSKIRLELETAMREVASGIRSAQNDALAGRRNANLSPCHFDFKLGANLYNVEGEFYNGRDCENGTKSYAIIESGEFPKGVNVVAKYKGKIVSNIGFNVPFGEVTVDRKIIDKSIRLSLSKEGVHYIVCVSPSGRIDELGDTILPCEN